MSAFLICPTCKARCVVLYDRRFCAACNPYPHGWYREWWWLA